MKKLTSILFTLFLISCSDKSLHDRIVEINNPGGTEYFYLNYPTNKSSFLTSGIEVSGIATNKAGVVKVEVFVNNVPVTATNINNWHANVTLTKGIPNTIFARATLQNAKIVDTDPITVYYNWEKINDLTIETANSEFIQNGSTVYIYGGQKLDTPLPDKMYAYNLDSNTFSTYTVNPRFKGGMALYNSNLYLISGMKDVGETMNNATDYYNASGVFQGSYATSPQSIQRDSGTVVSTNTSKAYIIGGYDINKTVTSTIIEVNLTTGLFTEKTNVGNTVRFPQAFYYNNKIIFFGGLKPGTTNFYSDQFLVYDPATNNFSSKTNPLKYNRCGARVLIKGSKAYVIGGEHYDKDGFPTFSDKVELLDLTNLDTDQLTAKELAPMPIKTGYFAAAIYNNEIYIFGGKTNESPNIKKHILKYTPEE